MDRQYVHNTIRLPAISDGHLINLLHQLCQSSGQDFLVQTGNVQLGTFKSRSDFLDNYPEQDWDGSHQLAHARAKCISGIVVYFDRRVTTFGANQQPERTEASAWEAEIWIGWPREVGQPSAEAMVTVSSIVETYKTRLPNRKGRSEALRDLLPEVYARQLTGLTDIHTKIVREAAETRREQEKELADRRQQLESETDAIRSKIAENAESETDRLRRREADLNALADELQNQGHMHERRQLRAKISNDLKERLSRPSTSISIRQARILIFSGGIVLGFLAFAFAGYSTQEFAQHAIKAQIGNNILTYILIARIALSSAAAFGIGLYLIGWARQLHDNDLRADRELERYRYDLDRASWAIETILEAQVKDGNREALQVPDEWISGATHELFSRAEIRNEDHSVNEALGALLSYAAEAEIGPGGTKLKLTPRGVKKLKRHGLIED